MGCWLHYSGYMVNGAWMDMVRILRMKWIYGSMGYWRERWILGLVVTGFADCMCQNQTHKEESWNQRSIRNNSTFIVFICSCIFEKNPYICLDLRPSWAPFVLHPNDTARSLRMIFPSLLCAILDIRLWSSRVIRRFWFGLLSFDCAFTLRIQLIVLGIDMSVIWISFHCGIGSRLRGRTYCFVPKIASSSFDTGCHDECEELLEILRVFPPCRFA